MNRNTDGWIAVSEGPTGVWLFVGEENAVPADLPTYPDAGTGSIALHNGSNEVYLYHEEDGWKEFKLGGVSPEGTLLIVANGAYDVRDKASVSVNVQAVSNEDAIIEGSLSGKYVNDTATSIVKYGFAYKPGVTKIVMNGVETIGNYGFIGDAALEEATFENAVSIGMNAFSDCTALREVTIPKVKTLNGTFSSQANLETVNAGSLETIGQSTFSGCSKLKTIDLSTVKTLGMFAFSGCASLTRALLTQCTSLGTSSFPNCSALKEASVPLCSSTPSYAFKNCASLETVDFSKLGYIGSETFSGCTSLESIALPKAWSFSSMCFNGCTSLARVEAGGPESSSSTADLGSSTFSGCSSLTTLVLRRTTSIYTLGGTGTFDGTPFNTAGSAAYIYVPAALIDAYKAATNWTSYQSRFRVLEDYTVDGTTTGELDPTKI